MTWRKRPTDYSDLWRDQRQLDGCGSAATRDQPVCHQLRIEQSAPFGARAGVDDDTIDGQDAVKVRLIR